ncbi:MAG: UvrD-helicase domain-containing protein, partial [Candidatus Nitrosopelagicus sp.]|nr:UvrD-helicase domain-containing protein [Candidatus Nitrosopelagicus sp.]
MKANPEQQTAIEHTGSPLLVTAGPGSGKTRVITERIKFLLKTGLKPSEILCLTFSEKAANELKERI